MNIPTRHQQLMPYLILKDAVGFIDFCVKTFDATELALHKHDDGSVMHAEYQVFETTIMFGQSSNEWPEQTSGFFLYTPNVDELYANALANGALSVMGLEDKDYGRTCGIKDPAGNTWWLTESK